MQRRHAAKHRRYLKHLDRLDRGLYVGSDRQFRFLGLAGQQTGRPVDYRNKLNRRRKRKHNG